MDIPFPNFTPSHLENSELRSIVNGLKNDHNWTIDEISLGKPGNSTFFSPDTRYGIVNLNDGAKALDALRNNPERARLNRMDEIKNSPLPELEELKNLGWTIDYGRHEKTYVVSRHVTIGNGGTIHEIQKILQDALGREKTELENMQKELPGIIKELEAYCDISYKPGSSKVESSVYARYPSIEIGENAPIRKIYDELNSALNTFQAEELRNQTWR